MRHLLRNGASGRYYARWSFTVNGKEKQRWVNLKTDVFSVAKLRIHDEATKVESVRRSGAAVTAGKGTVGDLIAVYKESLAAHSDLKPASVTAREVALKKLLKTWPGIESLKPSQITPGATQEWANRFKTNGTAYTPPGARPLLRGTRPPR